VHSPWAAEAAFLLRLPAAFAGEFPAWPGMLLEVLVLSGKARIAHDNWYRGCYAFGGPMGDCTVSAPLTLYCRSFRRLA
jgi:hypothetical protein